MTYEPMHSNFLEIPEGWVPFVTMAIDQFKVEWPELAVIQVKEKFAKLRIYAEYEDNAQKFIDQAEKDCNKICMTCGTEQGAELVQRQGWLFRFCETCKEENK